MDQEEGSTTVDNIVTQFNTYEDFLDSQITTLDMYYLEVRAAAPRGGGHSFAFLGPSRAPASWGVRPLAVDRGNGRPRSFPTAVLRGLGPYRIRAPGVRDPARTHARAHARTHARARTYTRCGAWNVCTAASVAPLLARVPSKVLLL
ncbi:hypothetical protein J1605_022752 [Eschrichtius robustus]|uniref:Uncharacterized protein n=1 Tax=Eschrichtius robustus TaxID=9764 RepID=A0AB34H4K4_ESCRO|nr:hypothetical protein J1605_022752 [Eschrichtius robustus]